MSSIYRKLLFSFLTLNLFAIGAVGIYSYYKEKEALLSRTFDQLISVRQGKKESLISFFRQRIIDLENISQLPEIRSLYQTPPGKGKQGQHLPPAAVNYIKSYLKNARCYRRLLVYPRHAPALFLVGGQNNGTFLPLPANESDAWQLTLKTTDTLRRPRVCEMFPDRQAKTPAIVVEKEMFDTDGKPLGLLVLQIKWEAINTVMFENTPGNGLGKTGEVYLVGNDRLMRSNSRFLKDAMFHTRVKTLGARKALDGTTGTSQFPDYRGIPVLSAFSPLHFSGIRWAILAEIDTKEAMIPIYSIRDNIIYLSLLIALISAAIMTFLSKKISDPIKRLKEGTQKIAAGEYGSAVRVETKDEIGELTHSFNEMSVKLKSQADKLEKEKKLRLRSVLDAQEEERQRLSMELHDGLGPLLLAGKMKLEGALEAGQNAMTQSVKEVMGLFQNTVREIRNISNNMMPSGLKEFGLAVALENLCSRIRDNYPVAVHCHIDLKRKHYDKTTEIYLYRITQEAVNNVLKHAGATEIHLNLEEIDGHLYFTLSDNGRGFDASHPGSRKGNGLPNMMERVNLLNGFFELTTSPGKGTSIEIDIPVL